MDLYFSPAAQVELDEAFAYLEGEEPGLGYRFTADVDEAPLATAGLAPLITLIIVPKILKSLTLLLEDAWL